MDLGLRVIVSPVAGVFEPNPDLPTVLTVGDALGVVHTSADVIPVLSPFAGPVAGVAAVDGERLEAFQRVAWLHVAA